MNKKALTKADLIAEVSDDQGLTRAQVEGVLASVARIAQKNMSVRGGTFVLSGIVRLRMRRREARPARQGRNPSTGETIDIPARPVTWVVRAHVEKPLRDAALGAK